MSDNGLCVYAEIGLGKDGSMSRDISAQYHSIFGRILCLWEAKSNDCLLGLLYLIWNVHVVILTTHLTEHLKLTSKLVSGVTRVFCVLTQNAKSAPSPWRPRCFHGDDSIPRPSPRWRPLCFHGYDSISHWKTDDFFAFFSSSTYCITHFHYHYSALPSSYESCKLKHWNNNIVTFTLSVCVPAALCLESTVPLHPYLSKF